MQFSAFAYLASAIAATFGVSIESVLVDISTIKERLTSLDSAMSAYPVASESVDDAVGIHHRAEDTRTAIIKTIKDVKTIRARVTMAEGLRVLNSINDLKPIVLDALKTVVAKKSAISNSKSIFNYVADDLTEFNLTTLTLEDLLISRAPPELLDEANAIKAEIDEAFIVALAAYSSKGVR